MSLSNVFNLSGSALHAQNVRLNTIALNIANADSIAGSPETTFRAQIPVFRAVFDEQQGSQGVGVRVVGIVEDTTAPRKQYMPENPMADDDGFIYMPNINAVEQMSNMMSASRSFQVNIEMMNTAKELMMRTLTIGQ
ncbi:MAG: flagellar basal body rod protein FlgC [Pseudomonadota bacterium]